MLKCRAFLFLRLQKIIRKYTECSGNGYEHSALASALGSLTWERPSFSEFQLLARYVMAFNRDFLHFEGKESREENNNYKVWICRESEYAAWTLVNGYALNHVTVSVHRLKSHIRKIKNLNQFIEENGFRLNSEGGVLKGQDLQFCCLYAIER